MRCKICIFECSIQQSLYIPAKISPLNDGIEPPFVFPDRYLPKWQKTSRPAKKITPSGILM